MTGRGDRLDWLDAAKGLGIILVVAGHVWTRGPVRDAIYAFHMPLFFLLAGYVAVPRPARACLLRQWSSLAVPYIAFLLTLMLADPVIEHLRGHRPLFPDVSQAARAALLGGTELRGPFTIFWFVPCLIVARLIQNLLAIAWPDPRDWRWAAAMVAASAIGLWAGEASDYSPLGLLTVPIALLFLWLGALWRTLPEDRWLLAVAALASAVLLGSGLLAPLNMKVGDYGTPRWSLFAAAVLSLGLCWVSRVIPWRPLRALGRMSLVIMFLHVPVIHYLAPYFGQSVLFAVSLIVPACIASFLSRVGWGRRWFLGTSGSGTHRPSSTGIPSSRTGDFLSRLRR